MSTMLPAPTKERVRAACEEFDRRYQKVEQAVAKLFTRYSDNRDFSAVLWKVTVLNAFYSTRIFAYAEKVPSLVDVAQHIYENAQEIDSALGVGLPGIVEVIAGASVPGKKNRNHFSFATKYCGFHKPDLYPIWDSNVQKYLGRMQKQSDFARGFNINADHWTYDEFREAMIGFRNTLGLGSFSFKEIDKFLWSYDQ